MALQKEFGIKNLIFKKIQKDGQLCLSHPKINKNV